MKGRVPPAFLCFILLGIASSVAASFCDQICTDITGTWVNTETVPPYGDEGKATVTFYSDGSAYYQAELEDSGHCPVSGYANYDFNFSDGQPTLHYTVTTCQYDCSGNCNCPQYSCDPNNYSYHHSVKFYDDCDYFVAGSGYGWRLVEPGSGSGRNPCLIVTVIFGTASLVCCFATFLLLGMCIAWRRRRGKTVSVSSASATSSLVLPISGYYLEPNCSHERGVQWPTEGSNLLPTYPYSPPPSSSV